MEHKPHALPSWLKHRERLFPKKKKKKKGREKKKLVRWLDGITDLMYVSLSELREMVMDRDAWHAVIHWVAKSRIRLSD